MEITNTDTDLEMFCMNGLINMEIPVCGGGGWARARVCMYLYMRVFLCA